MSLPFPTTTSTFFLSSVNLTTGFEATACLTVTVLVIVAVNPPLSVTLYITLYTPAEFELTPVVSVIILLVISPSSLSYAVAPKSIYSVPLLIVTALLPINVTRMLQISQYYKWELVILYRK